MSKETRDRIAFRMQPETRRRIEQWYAADNCQSMNEFVEKGGELLCGPSGDTGQPNAFAYGDPVCH